MLRKIRTSFVASASDHVQDAGGEELLCECPKHQRRNWSARRWLQDNGVPCDQRWADLPAGHQQRVVPRRDRSNNANGIAANHAGAAWEVFGDSLPLHVAPSTCEVAQVVDDRINLNADRADRLASVLGLSLHKLALRRLKGVGEFQQRERALGRSGGAPCWKGRRGRGHCSINIGATALWNSAQHLAR